MSALASVREITANDRLFQEASELRGADLPAAEAALSWDAAVIAVLLRDLVEAVNSVHIELEAARNRKTGWYS